MYSITVIKLHYIFITTYFSLLNPRLFPTVRDRTPTPRNRGF
ncbi:hypothetical protein QUA56_01550 [Microcoleus sp. N3A4]